MGSCRRHSDITLFDLQRKHKNKDYLVPEWQRDDVWTEKKKKDFEETVLGKARKGRDILTGCVIIYSTKDNPNKTFISDGLQRTLNSSRIYDKLVKNHGMQDAEGILSRISVPILEMEYENEKEAKNEFRRINQGTPLTEKEEAKTILTDLCNYEDWEKRILNKLHEYVRETLQRFGSKEPNSRPRQHATERDDYALFLRYITEEKVACQYSFEVGNLDVPHKKDAVLEQRMITVFNQYGIDKIEDLLKSFKSFIIDQGEHIKAIWNGIDKSSWSKNIQTLTAVCFRVLLHYSIFRKNNAIPVDLSKKFVEAFLKTSRGTSNVRFIDGTYTIIAKADLSTLIRLQTKLGVIVDPNTHPDIKRKRISTKQNIPGYHNAHDKAYAKHGNGPTTPQPAVDNMSNGVLSLT